MDRNRGIVRKAVSADWQRASFVDLRRMEGRAVEEGEERDSCMKGRVEERSNSSMPSSSK